MKYYIISALLFLSACENKQVGNMRTQPFLLNKHTHIFSLKYVGEQDIKPSNLKQFIQTLKSKKKAGCSTTYITLFDNKYGGIWSKRRKHIEKSIFNAGLYAIKTKKLRATETPEARMRVPITTYEAKLNVAVGDFGYSYYHNMLQNLDDVSALFNEPQKPVLVDAKMTTAAINTLYADSNVDDDTQDSDEAGAGDLQADLLAGLLGGGK